MSGNSSIGHQEEVALDAALARPVIEWLLSRVVFVMSVVLLLVTLIVSLFVLRSLWVPVSVWASPVGAEVYEIKVFDSSAAAAAYASQTNALNGVNSRTAPKPAVQNVTQ